MPSSLKYKIVDAPSHKYFLLKGFEQMVEALQKENSDLKKGMEVSVHTLCDIHLANISTFRSRNGW